MNNVLKLNFLKRGRPSGMLGLTLDGSRLDGVVLRRTNGALQVQQSFSVTLSLDPLTAAPELSGREIRNHLDAAGVRERNCVVGLPLKWALMAHAEVPQIPEADLPGFLQIEAERGFPCDISTLRYATSVCQLPGGKQYVTFAGVPAAHVDLLEKVLLAARLKPASFTLGLPALQPPKAEASAGVVALTIGDSYVGAQVSAGGGG